MKKPNIPPIGKDGKPKKMNFGSLKRIIKMLYSYYPKLLPISVCCIIFAAITASVPAIFQQQVLKEISTALNWEENVVTFNSGENSKLMLTLEANGSNSEMCVDDITIKKSSTETDDIILDDGFENDIRDRSIHTTNIISDTEFRNGDKSLLFPDKRYALTTFDFSAEPNTDYTLTYYIKRSDEDLLKVKIDGDANIYSGFCNKKPSNSWNTAKNEILPKVIVLGVLYLLSLIAVILQSQLMAIITQGFLGKMRKSMFNGMQNLPVKYFDTHKHGDIMSFYTNDIDTLRQLVSQSIPSVIQAAIVVFSVFIIMLWYSVWMTLVVISGVALLFYITKKVGGGSAKFFIRQQKSIGKTEGFVQEMMSGQKVVKVFCHEDKSRKKFEEINNQLFEDSNKAHAYANCLGPINMNIGNILYVIVATVGGLFLLSNFPNFSISGMAFEISIVIPFLNMTKQFTGNINQVSQQINAIVMGLAGAERIFALMDEQEEVDDGYVTLVNAEYDQNGEIKETAARTGIWAWKHPHKADGTVTYTKLMGEVTLNGVDFEYTKGKPVLFGVDVYANPGQKVAFVGATGAGKTTITNLINRFYDIADGKIRYDGININKIKKSDLRRSLGIVLQETNLFTGTVMDNIRYGRLDATDEECIEAARLSGADDFITRLPGGYDTELTNNGSNLSQGQRQLIAIARAAVADPPVMILDEATSSIDTRTEAIVQRGMDRLMQGRTVFVIAHRLSTVKNSDVIMVLDKGRIIERGNHDKLIAEKGQYYQLYTGAFELE